MNQRRISLKFADNGWNGDPVVSEVILEDRGEKMGYKFSPEEAPECLSVWNGRETHFIPLIRLIKLETNI